jgi:putative membrane protein
VRRILVIWLSNVAAIFVASAFVDGVSYSHQLGDLLVAGAVFGVVNLFVKPIVTVLSLPLILLSFGVALFFVNLFMLYLTSWIVGSFHIATFMDAVWATIVVWVVNVALDLALRRVRKARR